MKKIIIVIVCLLFTIATSLHAQPNQNFTWLVNSWRINLSENTSLLEIWEKQNDSLYTSKSFFITKKDTSLQETVNLVFKNNKWKYIATAADENDNKPVTFAVIFISKEEFICTNPAHDFPIRIAYRLVNNGKLYASIEGFKKGKYKKVNYDYLKL